MLLYLMREIKEFVSLLFFYLSILEGEEGGEEEKHQFVFPVFCAFIVCALTGDQTCVLGWHVDGTLTS